MFVYGIKYSEEYNKESWDNVEIKAGKCNCEHCGKGIIIKEQFVQEKDNEIALRCPWCKNVLGEYTTFRNKMYIAFKVESHS